MLTIAPGVEGSDTYFSSDNYYTKDEGIEHSYWYGQGLAQLGMAAGGQVNPDMYQALWLGEVAGRRLGRVKHGQVEHRPGWDLTFSAPKSLSILSEVYGMDELRVAHEKAVKHALNVAERMIDCRVTVNGKAGVMATGNGVFACFTHDTNRNMDCQLHTHAFMLNMTATPNGWRSIKIDRIFNSQREKTLGLEYRAALAIELVNLGYRLTPHRDPSLFEIEGVPQALIKAFSTRAEQIERWFVDNSVAYSPAIAKTVSLMSRTTKKHVGRDELRVLWREVADRISFDIGAVKRRTQTFGQEDSAQRSLVHAQPNTQAPQAPQAPQAVSQHIPDHVKKAVRHAIVHLTERDMAFTLKDLKSEAFKFGLGKSYACELDAEINRLKDINQLQRAPTHPDSGKKKDNQKQEYWTTPKMKNMERLLIDIVLGEKGIGKGLVDASIAEKSLEKTKLNAHQRGAILAALTSGDRFFAIQGDPGVGKTTALNEYKKILNRQGFEVLGMAPNYQAVGELTKSLNIQGMTVDRYIADPTSVNLGRALRKQVWVVDETSMLATDRVIQLMELAKERNARVLFVGDHQQLESVGAGRGFKHVQDAGIGVVSLKEWVRPKTDYTKEIFRTVMTQSYGETFGVIAKNGGLHVNEDEDKGLVSLAKEWLSLSAKERKETLIVTPTNEQCKKVNDYLRAQLKELGDIGKNEQTYKVFQDKHMTGEEVRYAGAYRRGDVVRFADEHLAIGKNKREHILKNEYFRVEGVNEETNALALKSLRDNRTLFVDPSKIGGQRGGGIQVYTQDSIGLSQGDKVRWLDNKNSLGVKRNTELTVERLTSEWIRFTTDRGESIKIPLNDYRHLHFSHNYAKTAYNVQGSTCKNVLAMMSSWRVNSVHARSFMVALTRASMSVSLYVDNASKAIAAMRRTGNNAEALTKEEFGHALTQSQSKARSIGRSLI